MANITSIKVRKTDTVYGIQDAAASLAIEQMKNGTDIDSFGDVETALDSKVDNSKIGANNGIAELDANGRVPSSQLPSYVDDVLEYASQSAFPATGETGKIYIALDTNKTFRWSGSAYVEISESLALGETSSTAYAGNKGKANADAIAAMKDGSSIDSFGDVETALAGKVDKVTGKGLSTNDYDNTAKGIVDNIQSNVIANTKLIKDTVGWTNKNKAEPLVGYTLSGDGNTGFYIGTGSNAISYIAKVEQGKKYKVTKDSTYGDRFRIVGFVNKPTSTPDNTAYQFVFDNTKTEYEVTNTTYNYLVFTANLSTSTTVSAVKGMIRSADILDDTYEPYFGSTAFPRSEQAVLGAKNLANLEYREMTNNSTFTESNGVYTIANNNGTSQYPSMKIFKTSAFGAFPAGKYTLSVNIVSFTNNTAVLAFRNASDNAILSSKALSVGKMSITYESAVPFTIGFLLRLGSTADTEIQFREFMIALDNDLTYAPFAMTNKELTEKVLFNYQNITKNGLLISGSRQGNIVIISFYDGTNTEAYNSNDSLVGLSDFDKLFSASDTFAIQTEVLETYGKTARLYTVSGDIKTRSEISAGTVIRGTLVGVIK